MKSSKKLSENEQADILIACHNCKKALQKQAKELSKYIVSRQKVLETAKEMGLIKD